MALIAVVNDDTAFLQLMEDVLTDVGYRVRLLLTTDGVEETLAQERPALMILDIVIDLRDAGLRLLRRVRRDPALADLPVIVCSADSRFLNEHAEELATLDCAVVEKPFDLNALLQQIEAHIGALPDVQVG
jgi:DNA-binding response OmpR family regulator